MASRGARSRPSGDQKRSSTERKRARAAQGPGGGEVASWAGGQAPCSQPHALLSSWGFPSAGKAPEPAENTFLPPCKGALRSCSSKGQARSRGCESRFSSRCQPSVLAAPFPPSRRSSTAGRTTLPARTVPDGAQRKRRISETHEGIFSKCIKKSDKPGKVCDKSSEKRHHALEQVKCFIQSQLDSSLKTLDHSLELLNQRIDHTQCLQKNEAIAIKIVKKISRLDRRIDAIIRSQKRKSSRNALPTRAPLQNETLDCPSPQHGNANSMPALSKETPSNLNKTIPKNTESSEDIICISWVKKSSDVGTVNPTGVQQKEASVNATTSAETPCNSKNSLLIDLTDEGDDSNKDGTPSSSQYCATKKTNSTVESLVPNHPQPVVQSSNQVPEAFRHLPPLPQVEQQLDALRPQKLHLTVAQVENPKGFGLRWWLSKVQPWFAPLDSFHLFACLETVGKGVPTSWMKVSEIKAMPLPMACSLARFPDCSKCYFTILSKDIYGRYGPYSDIQAISVT
nr:activating transcription factor 7-interacting protein 2 [Zootoca vivipara]